MQKVNVDVYIWNKLRSNDRFGFVLYRCTIFLFICYNLHTDLHILKKNRTFVRNY